VADPRAGKYPRKTALAQDFPSRRAKSGVEWPGRRVTGHGGLARTG
jgi:hypothetical protein